MVDWNRIRRTDSGLSQDEKEELLKRLNEYVNEHRSVDGPVFADEPDWDYREEENE